MASATKAVRRERERATSAAKMAEGSTMPRSPSSPAYLEEVSAAVSEALSPQFAALHEKMDVLQSSVGALGNRMAEAEERIGKTEDSIEKVTHELASLQAQIQLHTTKLDELENRSRRNNLRIMGIPESVADKDLKRYVETLFPQLFEGLLEGGDLIIDRIHRVGSRQTQDRRPKVVLARFLHFPQKEAILRAARQRGALTHENLTFRIAQDYSAALSLRRRAYAPLCQQLIDAKVKFLVQYPARLRVYHEGGHKIFDSAEAAAPFVADVVQGRSSPAHLP